MENEWNKIRTEYIQKLEIASTAADICQDLVQKVSHPSLLSIRPELKVIREQLEKELERLKGNCFNVAVIGLEKAGKSLLLNAWLGADVLPSMPERCTYTSTELWSAPSPEEERYIIEYYGRDEFFSQLKEKKLQKEQVTGSDKKKLENEIEEIQEHLQKIEEYLGKDTETHGFKDVTELRGQLDTIISSKDKARARSVKRIKIYTMKLRIGRDIVFHDVPGFNSPIELHKQQTIAKLKECDAIIYTKEYDKPDLEGNEEQMLSIADQMDPFLTVADKIFIALTKVDRAKDGESLKNLIDKAGERWKEVDRNHLIPVAAISHLCKMKTAKDEHMKLKETYIHDIEKLGIPDGIEELQLSIYRYMDNERSKIISKRCENILKECRRLICDGVTKLSGLFPESVEDLEKSAKKMELQGFEEWWKNQWELIKEQFAAFYIDQIIARDYSLFKTRFDEIIEQYSKSLFDEERISKRIVMHGLSKKGVVNYQYSHAHIRKEIESDAMKQIYSLSASLTSVVEGIEKEIAQWCYKKLWEIDGIVDELLDEMKGDESLPLQHAFKTLFLRFARPTITLFIETPRDSLDRKNIVEHYKKEIELLKIYYAGDTDHLNLENFLVTGQWCVEMAEMMGAVPAGSSHVAKAIRKSIPVKDPLDPFTTTSGEDSHFGQSSASDIPSILSELKADIDSLKDYLQNSVYYGAGFIDFCQQELDKIKDRFLGYETTWKIKTRLAMNAKNSLLLKDLPDTEMDIQFKANIVNEIVRVKGFYQQLGIN
ncbi:MAG: dynamin family protein [Candidatus Xenobiia bacterium LiM19]